MREKELEEVAKRQKGEVDRWFMMYDSKDGVSDGRLDREEVKKLLTHVVCNAPSEGALNLAMSLATPDEEGKMNGITKKDVSGMVAKVSQYMRQQATIDPVFEKWDSDGNGVLDEEETLNLLKMVAGPIPGVEKEKITQEDVKFIIMMCDKSSDGGLDRSELMFACVTWKQIVTDGQAPFQVAEKPKSSMCALL